MGKMRLSIVASVVLLAASQFATANPVFSISDLVAEANAPATPSVFVTSSAGTLLTGGSSIFFNTASATNQNAAFPGDDVTIGTVSFTPGTGSAPATFDMNFDYKITLTDTASTLTDTFDLTGELTGSETGTPASIVSSYKNLALSTSGFTLGGNPYSVSIASTSLPTPNNAGNLELLVVSVPEPATISVALLAGGLLLKRRR